MVAKGAVLGGLLVAAALIGGCQPQTTAGPVLAAAATPGWENGPAVGLAMPRVEFAAADGSRRWLRGNSDWVTVIAFVSTEGKECNNLMPVLVDAAGRYFNKPVRVVQMAEPREDIPHCTSCVESGHAHLLHLLALCDGAHQASAVFGHPAPGTLLIVGSDGKVAAIGKVDEIKQLYPKLDEMAGRLRSQSMDLYERTYVE